MSRTVLGILVLMALCCGIVMPVSAVIEEVTVKGTVSALNPVQNAFSIANPLQYGCTYPAEGTPVCTFSAMEQTSLTGTAPAESAFALFGTGDPVVATSLGGAGNTWITLAKLFGTEPEDAMVTDIVGDPGTVPLPLIGDYALEMSTTPDCNACSGTVCTAVSSVVKIKSGGAVVMEKTLTPRQTMLFNGRNDGSSVEVSFVKGQAVATTCAGGRSGMTGPQPVSVYLVHVVPPIGTATHLPVTATTVATEIPKTVPTTPQKSATLPLVALGAVGLVAVLAMFRNE